MDKIIMKNLVFYGYHGVLPEESTLGQRFYIDAELFLDLKEAGRTDDVRNTVSYADVLDLIREIATGQRFKLIEALAEKIAAGVLEKYTLIKEIKITVRKPQAPVRGIFDYFAVEIRRTRND
ncbi:MAG: dihydroneopterin aldolase [Peptococcaceae bacterium]